MHDHSVKEDTIKEILAAFQAQDKDKKGYISTQEARNILTHLGEGLSRHEGLFMTNLIPANCEVNRDVCGQVIRCTWLKGRRFESLLGQPGTIKLRNASLSNFISAYIVLPYMPYLTL